MRILLSYKVASLQIVFSSGVRYFPEQAAKIFWLVPLYNAGTKKCMSALFNIGSGNCIRSQCYTTEEQRIITAPFLRESAVLQGPGNRRDCTVI